MKNEKKKKSRKRKSKRNSKNKKKKKKTKTMAQVGARRPSQGPGMPSWLPGGSRGKKADLRRRSGRAARHNLEELHLSYNPLLILGPKIEPNRALLFPFAEPLTGAYERLFRRRKGVLSHGPPGVGPFLLHKDLQHVLVVSMWLGQSQNGLIRIPIGVHT